MLRVVQSVNGIWTEIRGAEFEIRRRDVGRIGESEWGFHVVFERINSGWIQIGCDQMIDCVNRESQLGNDWRISVKACDGIS